MYKYNRGSSPLPAFVEDLSLRRPRLGLVAMQLRGHEERTETPPERGGGAPNVGGGGTRAEKDKNSVKGKNLALTHI